MRGTKAFLSLMKKDEVAMDDHITGADLFKSAEDRKFVYKLNDKATKKKLLSSAKRPTILLEENSSSSNLKFSVGAWHSVVLPAVRYWGVVKADQKCNVGDYTIRVGGVKSGNDAAGSNVDNQVIFFADRDKIVCHLYNTTQNILVNGRGYIKFINIFLKPFFESKIESSLNEIQSYNETVLDKLGQKMVKRSSVKFKGGATFDCNRCEHISKNSSSLSRHKRMEHSLSFNASQSLRNHLQSTRNNSISENLMLEDLSIINISDDKITLEEKPLSYTCKNCNIKTTSKSKMDKHVKLEHLPFNI